MYLPDLRSLCDLETEPAEALTVDVASGLPACGSCIVIAAIVRSSLALEAYAALSISPSLPEDALLALRGTRWGETYDLDAMSDDVASMDLRTTLGLPLAEKQLAQYIEQRRTRGSES
ncbi:hypothetical protein DC31_14005 [Microbacterium sp. CH12i]|nr:hypothetical protein DC31_14005 [Microbacterium sp. CH12i]